MSGADFGGVMNVTDSAGNALSLRGTFNVNPSGYAVEAVAGGDGSVDRTFTVQPVTAEINFADKGIDLAAIMGGDRRSITLVEDKTGVIHLFNDAFYTGAPGSNRMNGEVTGVGIACASTDYRKMA